MTPEEKQECDHQRRLAGKRIIDEQARRQVRTFLDELKNGTQNYRTVASLGGQVAQEYRGRAILELLQNAHDVLAFAHNDDPRQISFVLKSSPEPELLVANSGRPFLRADFSGICQLAQSPKDPNESVGNKGLGFQSVLELTTCPEVWSTAPVGGDAAFTFGFHPGVREPIGQVAQRLVEGDPPTDPALGTEHVVDWSQDQIQEYRRRLSLDDIDPVEEVNKYLSPYVVPCFLDDPPCKVAKLLEDGHVTVIRLPLDGGTTGSSDEAIKSVREQLRALDEAAMVFLRHVSVLRIDIDEKRVDVSRKVDSELSFSAPGTRQRLRVSRAAQDASDATERSFHLWSRIVGGEGNSVHAERIGAAVHDLPNRWPEMRQVDIAVAVEETPKSCSGVFVIFLPTDKESTVGARLNAPFYGSLNRRQIYFDDKYNKLLLEFVADLILDATIELVEDPPEPWRGRAVIDLLAKAGSSPATDQALSLTDLLRHRAHDQGRPLDRLALILCDGGWRLPGVARTMPAIPNDDPIGRTEWRRRAGFAVASSALDERRDAVEALLRSLGGVPRPGNLEWAHTLERIAEQVSKRRVDATWNGFLSSVLSVLPPELRSEPKRSDADPLFEARFLPTEDRRLLAASDAAQIFFRPRRGADDAADFVGSIPASLKQRIAFIDPGVKTHEGKRNTEVQKFLDGRFVQSFRREDLLRDVVIPSLPELPATHGSPDAAACADTLRWTLEMIGQEEQESLLPLLSRLPVACVDGWFPMGEATFGPGWIGRCGDHLRTVADGLPDAAAAELLGRALLPPDDAAWVAEVTNRGDLFAHAGVADGLRLETNEPIRFRMSRSHPELPDTAPATIPQSAWDDWRQAARGRITPEYWGEFNYELSDVKGLPELHRKELSDPARSALSNLILVSLAHWEDGWEQVTIKKRQGLPWLERITSPLKHWLSTLPWLDHGPHGGQKPLRHRWFVPESLLRGQRGRFRHLAPLSLPLAHRLAEDMELLRALEKLGLNVYPTEDALTGPNLLEALADVAKARNAMPAGGFDVFLGQVRHAWRHLDPVRGLPEQFVVRTKPRTFTVRNATELKEVYLPDHIARTRSLREHGQPILAMRQVEANGPVGILLHEIGARRASGLKERWLIDGRSDAQAADGARTLDKANLNWLPVVLLTLAAHGGGNPRGPATDAWRQAARRFHHVRVRHCHSIAVELLDAGRIVASSEPRAHWLSPDDILLLNWDVARSRSYEAIAAASQAILERQDLLKDLRLVLGSLTGKPHPTAAQIDAALDRAEIDAEAVADIRLRWYGETSMLLDRIRPVAKILDVSDTGLDAAATDTVRLTTWLSEKIVEWPNEDLLTAARECHDDFEMGLRAWQVLDDAAELPRWNDALQALGGEYGPVENDRADDQAKRHLEEAARSLRAFARHVATTARNGPKHDDQARLFSEINAVHEHLGKGAIWPRLYTEWSQRWWEVPFGAVLGALRLRYEGIPAVKPYLEGLAGVRTIDEFNSELQRQGVALEPDPLEVARDNWHRLNGVVRSVWVVYEAWLAQEDADSARIQEAPEVPLDASMYLREWSEADVLIRAKEAVDNQKFLDAVARCTTTEEMRATLDIGDKNPPATSPRGSQEGKGTYNVGGKPHEIDGPETYTTLLRRLEKLPEPTGPRADIDELTSLDDSHLAVDPPAGRTRVTKPKTAHLHGSPHLPELVGIVGEMHAFRFLRSRFNIDEHAWVSEFRARVLPLREDEMDETSDSLGYDFRFAYAGETWCVEVKATTDDGTSFVLAPGQIDAASRIATKKDERWRILRVRRAMDEQPECDWLPNPFEPGAGQRLRLRHGSMAVEYTPSKDMGNHG